MADFDLDAVLAEVRKPKAAAPPKPPATKQASPLARSAAAPVRSTPTPKVEESVPVEGPRPGMDVVAPEIAKQKAAFDEAYARATEAYRAEHDPRRQAFEEHNAEIANTVGPLARTALSRALYVPKKVAEGVVAADAAYDELPFVKEGRARFAAAQERPERPAPVRAATPPRTPTIEVPVVAPTIPTPPSPGFTPTETFEVGEPETAASKRARLERVFDTTGVPDEKLDEYLRRPDVQAALK